MDEREHRRLRIEGRVALVLMWILAAYIALVLVVGALDLLGMTG